MNFKGRSFLKLLDYTPEEIGALIDLAAELKYKVKPDLMTKIEEAEKTANGEHQLLRDKVTEEEIARIVERRF